MVGNESERVQMRLNACKWRVVARVLASTIEQSRAQNDACCWRSDARSRPGHFTCNNESMRVGVDRKGRAKKGREEKNQVSEVVVVPSKAVAWLTAGL